MSLEKETVASLPVLVVVVVVVVVVDVVEFEVVVLVVSFATTVLFTARLSRLSLAQAYTRTQTPVIRINKDSRILVSDEVFNANGKNQKVSLASKCKGAVQFSKGTQETTRANICCGKYIGAHIGSIGIIRIPPTVQGHRIIYLAVP